MKTTVVLLLSLGTLLCRVAHTEDPLTVDNSWALEVPQDNFDDGALSYSGMA